MALLRMRDYLTIVRPTENKRYLFECRDSKSPTGSSLSVDLEATHSGIINGNARFYRPDRMQDGAHTWVPKGRPPIPMIVNHDRKSDRQGSVVRARYVDQSYNYAGQGVKNLLWYDGRQRLDLFKSVDWVVRNLHGKDGYKGLGYIELGVNLTNPDAIAKVLRDEYLTVSVGFTTDAAICSACHQDWAEDGKCDHKLGQVVDGRPMFLISGSMNFEEVSWVTFPADPWAAVTNKDSLLKAADSIAHRIFWMGLPEEDRIGSSEHVAGLIATDSLESDIQLVADFDERTEDEMDLKVILDEIKSEGLTKERAAELKTQLDGMVADSEGKEKTAAKRALSTLNATIRTKGWADEDGQVTKAQVENKIQTLDQVLPTLADEAARSEYVAKLEAEAKAFGLDFTAPAASQDASDEGAETDSADDKPYIRQIVDAAMKDSKSKADYSAVVSALEALDKAYKSVADDDRYLVRGAVSATLEHWYSGSTLQYYKARLQGDDAKEIVVDRAEFDTLHAAVEKYEADAATAKSDKDALLAANTVLLSDQKKSLATVLVLGSVLLGEKGYQGLSDAEIKDKIQRRSGRSLVSLQDSVADLQEKLPNVDLKAASETTPVTEEGAREVADNARVEETVEPETAETDSIDTKKPALHINPRLIDWRDQAKRAAQARLRQVTGNNKE